MTSIAIDRTDGLSSSTAVKGPCRVATTANIALTGLQTIDGVVLAADDRVLVKDQTTQSENGIYVADSGPWRRAKDFSSNRDIRQGTRVWVAEGDNGDAEFVLTPADPITIGTTSLTFEQSTFRGGTVGDTDNAVLRADGTDGNRIQSSVVTIADDGKTDIPASGVNAVRVHGNNFVQSVLESYRDSASNHAMYEGFAARGTESAPAALQSGDILVDLMARGWDTDSFEMAAFFRITATEAWTTTAHGTKAGIWVTPNGGIANRLAIEFGNDGLSTVFGDPTADLGIATKRFVEESNNAKYNPGVTGVVAPYVSVRDRLRVSLDATSVKMLGDDSTDNAAILANVLSDISGWGGGVFHINRDRNNGGTYRFSSSIDLPAEVYIRGDGDRNTILKATGDFPVITSLGTSGAVRNRGGVSDLTIFGGGKANTSAHGIQIAWTNRQQFSRIRFHACRHGFDFSNIWQVGAQFLSVDGGGSEQNYRGFYGREVDPSNQNNALIAYGLNAQDVEDVGYRLLNFNGSKFASCESGGTGSHGWHLGTPSSGTEQIRWGHFVNCLSDTAVGDLLRIEKGSASDQKQMQFSNWWLGTSGGHGLHVLDGSLIAFNGFVIVATEDSAVNFVRSSRCVFNNAVINDFDSNANGDAAIRLEDSSDNNIEGNQVFTTIGTGPAVLETGSSSGNVVSGNNVGGSGMTIISSSTIAKGNRGYVTRNSGNADLLSGNTTVVVNHGLNRTPINGDIMVTPRHDPGTRFWVDNITSTQFTINVAAAPGSNKAFSWQADASRG